MPHLDPAAHQQVLDLLRQERKIEAIKHYREATGVGLVEAKTAVEALERGLEPGQAVREDFSPPSDPSLRADVLAELAAGRKIDAIKGYREATGLGLAESKHAVEALERELPQAGASPGIPTVKTSRGCLGVLGALVVLSAGLLRLTVG